jgi:hypothetical protein
MQAIKKAKTKEVKQVEFYLFLKATDSLEDGTTYHNIMFYYLGDSNLWLKERLVSLYNLFQPGNEDHLFLKHVLDTRFYDPKSDVTEVEWVRFCKQEALKIYYDYIHKVLKDVDCLAYKVASYKIAMDDKKVVEDSFKVVEDSLNESGYSTNSLGLSK